MAPIRIGFIGLSSSGWAAMASFPSLRVGSNAENYDIVALATRSEKSAKASSEKYSALIGHPIKAYFGEEGIKDLVQDPEVDMVVVSVKTSDHEKAMKPVLKSGKMFYLEWPAGAGGDVTRRIAEKVERKGTRHLIGLQDRLNPTFTKMRDFLNVRTIGEVKAVNMVVLCPREIAYWGPEIWDANEYSNEEVSQATLLHILISHQMEPFTYLLGTFSSVVALTTTQWPEATLIPSGRKKKNEVPDHYSIAGTLKSNGAQVNISWRAGYPAKGRRQTLWEIDGTEGIMRFEADSCLLHGDKGRLYLNDEFVPIPEGENGWVEGMARHWAEFAKGESGNYVTLKDGVRLKEFIDAVQTSAKEGKRVEL